MGFFIYDNTENHVVTKKFKNNLKKFTLYWIFTHIFADINNLINKKTPWKEETFI